jgi:hypothetical protein
MLLSPHTFREICGTPLKNQKKAFLHSLPHLDLFLFQLKIYFIEFWQIKTRKGY